MTLGSFWVERETKTQGRERERERDRGDAVEKWDMYMYGGDEGLEGVGLVLRKKKKTN